jgi:hypothetical protein
LLISTKLASGASSSQSENQSEKEVPFNKNVTNEVEIQPRKQTSPIQENHSYIGLDDLESKEWDISGWPEKWKRLEILNRGIYNGKWANQTMKRNQDDWYICRNIACQLGIPKEMKESLWQIFRPLDMRSFRKYESETKRDYCIRPVDIDSHTPSITPVWNEKAFNKQYLVIFAICALLYNQYRSGHQEKYYPGKEPEPRDRFAVQNRYARNLVDESLRDCNELLHQFAEQLGFSDEHIRSCMEKLRQDCPRLK